jgi:probable HAF family extracellular repeat protein
MSDLAGDQAFHPILWNGKRMIDLGTLGGPTGEAFWVNDAGHAVGHADLASGTHDGFLWKNGVMHALEPVDGAPCSNANSVNASDEVVGNVTDCQGHELAGVLWYRGSAFDLNSLIAPSQLHLAGAEYINDQGDIVGQGTLPNGDHRIFLLIPNQVDAMLSVDRGTGRGHRHSRHVFSRPRRVAIAAPSREANCRSNACAVIRRIDRKS